MARFAPRLFSGRKHDSEPAPFVFEFGDKARARLLVCCINLFEDPYSGRSQVEAFMEEAEKRLLREDGLFNRKTWESSADGILRHFTSCDTEGVLDFLELVFQSRHYEQGQRGVDEVNDVLREERLGFELSPWNEREVPTDESFLGGNGVRIEIDYPKVIRKDDEFLHSNVTRPQFELLSDPRFVVARQELLDAYEDLRRGEYDSAITKAGSSFESVLKTICTERTWAYDSDKDTCSALVRACQREGLFDPFYAPSLEAVGTIRNKLSASHGRGPAPSYDVTLAKVEHFLHLIATHTLFLVGLAKLPEPPKSRFGRGPR